MPSLPILLSRWNALLLLASLVAEVWGFLTDEGTLQGVGAVGMLVTYAWGYVSARRHPDEYARLTADE